MSRDEEDGQDDYRLPTTEHPESMPGLVEEGVDQTEGVLGTTIDACSVSRPNVKMPYLDESAVPTGSVEPSASSIRLWHQFVWGLLVVLGFIGSLSLLLAAAQTATFVNAIAVLPDAIRIPCYCVLGVMWLVILYAVIYAVRVLLRVRQSPQVSLATVARLVDSRGEIRTRELRNIRDSLQGFLAEYPRDATHKVWLQQLGLPIGEQVPTGQDLFYHLACLKDDSYTDTKTWLEKVNIHILGPLDDLASQCIFRNAKWVGFKTAVAPRGVFDTLIVLYYSWMTLRSICQIYNLRPSQWEMCLILAFAGANSVIAEKADGVAGAVEPVLSEELHGIMGSLAGSVLSVASVRSAEGTLNGLALYRFGQYVKQRAKPIVS